MSNSNSTVVKSPSLGDTALELLPILKELLKRKSAAGEEYAYFHSGKQAEARLRDECKRRLNLDSESRLPDNIMANVKEAVKMFTAGLMAKMEDDGYQVRSASFHKPFVSWETATANAKADGLRNRIVSERDLRGDGERLVCYQEERRKLAKRITSMGEKPGKYSPEEIMLVTARHEACQTVINKIVANANKDGAQTEK